ncbi:42356_t:CDS:1, partial [Gigaspora margarita]
CDISINIIPDANIKIVLTADLTTHIARRYFENYDDYGNIPYSDIKKDILLCDSIHTSLLKKPLKFQH